MIAELQKTFKSGAFKMGDIVTLREMIGSNEKTGLLTNESLLRLTLGSAEMLDLALNVHTSRTKFSVLENNLVLCVREAFPDCEIVEHPIQKRLNGMRFSGFGFTLARS